MTRKDYILLADVLNKRVGMCSVVGPEYTCVMSTALMVADALAADNEAFNKEHFLAVVRGQKALTSKPARRREYQPKTGQACGCRPGMQRDNCPQCEGTGQRIDFAAIRGAR